MAVTLADQRTIVNEADATTGWTGSNTVSAATSEPTPIESTGQLGMVVSNATHNAYFTITSFDFTTNPSLIYLWIFHRAELDTTALGGIMIQLGDGTNRIGFHLAGSDVAAFRHDSGPVGWQCLLLDTDQLASYPQTAFAGTFASLNEGAITQIGVAYKTLVKSVGGTTNCFWDILRRGTVGQGLTVAGGTLGDPGIWSEIATGDRAIGNQQAFGVVRALGTGSYGVQGSVQFGHATANTYFSDANVTVVWEDRDINTDKYEMKLVGGTGTNEFYMVDSTLLVPTGVGGLLSVASYNVAEFSGVSFVGWSNGITFTSVVDALGCVFRGCGSVDAEGADLNDSTFTGSVAATNTSALIWDVATDPDGLLDGTSFTKGAGTTHGIEFGLTSPLTMTLRNVTFSGYNASNNQDDSAIHVKRTTGTVTINIIGGTSPSYRTDGATVDIVANPVTTTITVVDVTDGSPIENARVYLIADSGGPLTAGTAIIDKVLTDVNGEASDTRTFASDQPITGWVRKGSSPPRYQQGNITGTIDSATGLSLTVQMVPDE